ncbi:uncharacterized protein B0H18DRAFT_1123594 [Fomitopsis serialis]|uniref:uncharacterized protein n=1 Tax=Fomitopsis serialis TaxID=139415 RepID=UPI0020080C3E|nr:uncharacterized protein B0H18DRAFT_1123594 [Neoantrodia serialis]KAH9917514.1 hypothetical protein B0H18DRAFT_1123594 [Neoantrodia serialis]
MQLSSLDPPGTRRRLPAPFAFSERTPDEDEVLKAVRHMKPFDTLPRILIPSSRYAWRPPRLFYAWPAPEKVLLDYAKKNKLARRARRKLSLTATMYEALHAMIRGDGVASINPSYLWINLSPIGMTDGSTILVSVYTNYDLKREDLPSDEMVEKIGQRLGMEGPPKWYLDGYRWCWEER